jgi:Tol biopolymer transport system component
MADDNRPAYEHVLSLLDPSGRMPMRRTLLVFLGLAAFAAHADLYAQQRLRQPADLFEFERIGLIAWSPARTRAAVEIHRPGRWLDRSIPTADIAVLDVESGELRVISPSAPDVVGFFRPAWSPDDRSLVFLSVDREARVRAWVWVADSGPPTLLTNPGAARRSGGSAGRRVARCRPRGVHGQGHDSLR